MRKRIVCGLVLLFFAQPQAAWAATPPVISGLTGEVGDRVAVLRWTAGGTGTAVACDVTGAPDPITQSSCVRTLPVTGLEARDTGFTNTSSRTYAVWATDTDGTTSDTPTTLPLGAVSPVTPVLSLAESASKIHYGTKVGLSGTMTRLGLPSGHQVVELWGGTLGTSTARLIGRMTTSASGTAYAALAPSRSTVYWMRFPGDAFSAAVESPHRIVTLVARVSAAVTPASIIQRETTVLHGQVLPPLNGAVLAVQRRIGTTWRAFSSVRAGADGGYSLPLRPAQGLYTLRVVSPPLVGLAPVASLPTALRVDARSLGTGMSGSDVLALQRSLASLHYLVGPMNGVFGADLRHAVITFEKVERLPRNGTWTAAERGRLGSPSSMHIRYPSSGLAVDVDITRQVLVLSRGGVVQMIADISSGGEYRYTYQGVTSVAHTPRGNFTIQHKINGVRISNLGYLYRPSYFSGGYAVHGEAYDVPVHPASHGCVRVTNYVADILYPLLVIGTPVHVFDE